MQKFSATGKRVLDSDLIQPRGLASFRLRDAARFHLGGRANATTSDSVTQALGANLITLLPWLSPQQQCRITAMVFSTTAGGGNARLGIYANLSKQTLYPGALLYDSGSKVVSGGPQAYALGTPIDVPPGTLLWLALANSAAITSQAYALAGAYPFLGLTTALGSAPQVGYQNAFAFAALPDPCTAAFGTFATTNIPVIGVALS